MQPDSTSVCPPTRTSRGPRGASSAYSKPAQGQSRSSPLDQGSQTADRVCDVSAGPDNYVGQVKKLVIDVNFYLKSSEKNSLFGINKLFNVWNEFCNTQNNVIFLMSNNFFIVFLIHHQGE